MYGLSVSLALTSVASLSIVGLFAECISPPPRAFVTPIVPGQKNEIVQPVETGSFGIFGWVSSESLHAIWRTEIVSPPCISRLQSRSLLVHRSSAYRVLMRNRYPGQKRHTSVFIRPVIINPFPSEVFSRTHVFFFCYLCFPKSLNYWISCMNLDMVGRSLDSPLVRVTYGVEQDEALVCEAQEPSVVVDLVDAEVTGLVG